MAQHILKCSLCGKYLLKDKCDCGGDAITPRPPKYSPDDPYEDYRRKVKRSDLEKKGLL